MHGAIVAATGRSDCRDDRQLVHGRGDRRRVIAPRVAARIAPCIRPIKREREYNKAGSECLCANHEMSALTTLECIVV